MLCEQGEGSMSQIEALCRQQLNPDNPNGLGKRRGGQDIAAYVAKAGDYRTPPPP